MDLLETVGAMLAALLALSALAAVFVRLVALPYLREHLVDPILTRLDSMNQKDAELETANRIAAGMFEGHMTYSEIDRGHLWDAIRELQRKAHAHE